MASVISSSVPERPDGIDDMSAFRRKLNRAAGDERVPLLVVRIPELGGETVRARSTAGSRTSRRCLRAFAEAKARVLRTGDLLAWDGAAHLLVALVAPARDGLCVATPSDCRATLVRLAATLASAGAEAPEFGWTWLPRGAGSSRLAAAIDEALERGAWDRERHAFLTSIGHELRTPLTSVRGYLETLLDEELDPETARRFLETASAEAARMGRLVDGLHDVSVLESDIRRMHGEQSDILTGLAAALSAVAPFAKSRRTVMSQLALEPLEVLLSTDRLTQILVNVLENAVKHGREAGRIFVSVDALDERYAQVCIDDDGRGVPPAERQAIFLLARRGANARGRGNGLGLALVRLTLERIGGEVDVSESPLGGARFRLRIPRASSALPAQLKSRRRRPTARLSRSARRPDVVDPG